MQPTRQPLSHGRWNFQHGPIDLVIGADGDAAAVTAAHEAAWMRFGTVLVELVAELPLLRAAVVPALPSPDAATGAGCGLHGAVARRMWSACAPHAAVFITPMAAVAGAVADELIAAYRRAGVTRAWVNNGGDIALHLQPGQRWRVGLVADVARRQQPALDGRFEITAESGICGIATSGWRGRSFSLGIADSATVLARSAAEADAAATIIANAVDIDDARIERQPAHTLKDDSDLGARLVTVNVPRLPQALVQQALHRGAQRARALQQRGLISAAVLTCQGQTAAVQPLAAITAQPAWPQRVPSRAASAPPLAAACVATTLHQMIGSADAGKPPPPAAPSPGISPGVVLASRSWSACNMKTA